MQQRLPASWTTRRVLTAGAAVSAVLTLAPIIDVLTVDTIANHVRDAYPHWGASTVDADRNAIAGYLVLTSVLGVIGWLVSVRVMRRSASAGRWVGLGLLGAGTLVALINLSMGGEAYDRIVPTSYAVGSVLPVLLGAVACVRAWPAHRPVPER